MRMVSTYTKKEPKYNTRQFLPSGNLLSGCGNKRWETIMLLQDFTAAMGMSRHSLDFESPF